MNLETESLGPLDIDIRVTDWNAKSERQNGQNNVFDARYKARNTQGNTWNKQDDQHAATKLVDLEIAVKDRTVKKYLDSIIGNLGERINEAGFKTGALVCGVKTKNRAANEFSEDRIIRGAQSGNIARRDTYEASDSRVGVAERLLDGNRTNINSYGMDLRI